MNRITKFLIVSFLFITPFLKAQEYTNIDFSQSTLTSGNWNNMLQTATSQTGMILNLMNDAGASTGAVLTVTDAFNFVNTGGTATPDPSLPFPATATADSFFGNDVLFGGATEPTGGMEFSGLNPAKYYSFKVFASRTGVTDNREAQYTFTGSNTLSATLNASNNTANIVKIYNVLPDVNGKITLAVQKGPNNNNTSGFYYLGAIQMITSDTPYADPVIQASIEVVYPNGGETWHATATPYISWTSQALTENITIQYSVNNGSSWATIATVSPDVKKYTWTVPYNTSAQCKVRVISGTATDESNNVFSIISNTDQRFKIVVLGSSTAAGAGPSTVDQAWVWLYRDYLTQRDTRYEVTNLAVGGYTTYDILPTGTPIPSGVNETIDTNRNITKAIDLGAEGIIVNMPSNDSNMGYSSDNQIANYQLIKNTATNAGIPLWICSVQPRDFGTNTTALAIQQEMVTKIPATFPQDYIDFWTGLANAAGNDILPAYDSGDGVHLNAAGHQILFERVTAKDIHTTVKNNDDGLSDITTSQKRYLIDFNQNSTAQYVSTGNWNNFNSSATNAELVDIVSDMGVASTIDVKIIDGFTAANGAGTTTPDGSLPYPVTATSDSFYLQQGNDEYAELQFSGLDPSKEYTFTIFSSRAGQTDTRIALYTITGENSGTATLNASSNTANTCKIEKIIPASGGTITLTMVRDAASTGLYAYLGLLDVQETIPVTPQVLLNCENGGVINGEFYEVDALRMHVMANGPGQSVNDFELVDNPNPTGINTSSKVMKFTRRTAGTDAQPWAGFYAYIKAGYDLPDVTENKYVHVKVLKPRISPVWFKLENPGNTERSSVNTQTLTGEWEDMVIDFSDLTGTYSVVALMPDRVSPLTDVGNIVLYFDDIVINNVATSTTLSVSDNDLINKVKFYPNPTSGVLMVESLEDVRTVKIFSIDGRQVAVYQNFKSGTTEINLENLSKGIYFVNFVAKNGASITEKVIKE